MRYVMVDLETWGTEVGCALRSIGAVQFSLRDEGEVEIHNTFYRNIETRGQEEAGLYFDPKTKAWWEKQSVEAQAALLPEVFELRPAMQEFLRWLDDLEEIGEEGKEQVIGLENLWLWSHGKDFDLPIVKFAARAVGVDLAWDFRKLLDTRTLFAFARLDMKKEPWPEYLYEQFGPQIKHHALHDALFQAHCVGVADFIIYENGSLYQPWKSVE